MLRHNESLEERQERWDRDLLKFHKQLRRERWSMTVLLIGWLLYPGYPNRRSGRGSADSDINRRCSGMFRSRYAKLIAG